MKAPTWYERTLLLEECVEITCFIFLFFSVLLQIFFRIKLISIHINYAPIWTEELSRWLYVYIVFFGASQGIHYREHIGIDLFVNKCPKAVQSSVRLFADIVMAIACVIIVYYGIRNMPFAVKQRPLTLPTTNGTLYAVIPITFSLMTIRTGFNILGDLHEIKLCMLTKKRGSET